MQFSIHSTDEGWRDKLMPMPKWPLNQIADYGRRFRGEDKRKITLNFALAENAPLEPDMLLKYFNPDSFLIKITPINPTVTSNKSRLASYIDISKSTDDYKILADLRRAGYDVILSIGEPEENRIGSNCGQYVLKYHQEKSAVQSSAYSYEYTQITETK